MEFHSKIVFLTGKMGVGKTTYAKELAEKERMLYLSEDEMLSSFYPNEINNIEDYIKYSIRIKPYVKQLVTQLIQLSVNIVMDFPGNTKRQRLWFKELIDIENVSHDLVYLKAEDSLCLSQIEKRRMEEPERHQFDTKELFVQITKYFEEPTIEEGLHLVVIER